MSTLHCIDRLFLKPLYPAEPLLVCNLSALMVDRSIGREKAKVHLRFLVLPPPRLPVPGMHSRYFESASPPVWSWYPFVSIPFPSFMATCKHCSYARKKNVGKTPSSPPHPCGNINRR